MLIEISVFDETEYIQSPCRLNVGDVLFEDLFSEETKRKLLDNSSKPVLVVTHSWFRKTDGVVIQCVNTELEYV